MPGASKKKSALSVSEGVAQPDSINRDAVEQLKKSKKRQFSTEQLFDGIRQGDITMLSQAITLVESSLPKHQSMSQELIAACLPYSGSGFRLGITGVPGAGKSTFIESLGLHLINRGLKLAVLAIDPSSLECLSVGSSLLAADEETTDLAFNLIEITRKERFASN